MRHLRIFARQLAMGLKLHSRTPSAIFWLIAFPIVMLLGMGTVFGGNGSTTVKLVWARPALAGSAPASVADTRLQQALEERGIELELLSGAQADERWQAGKLAVLLEGTDGRYALRVNSYLRGQGMGVEALVQQAFLQAQARAQGVSLERIPVATSSPGGHHDGPYAAYLLPGLLGLNVLVVGVFSVGIVDVTMRAKGGYKRLATTPLPRSVYLGAQLCGRLIVVLFAAALLMLTGALVFGIHNQGSYWGMAVFLLLGAGCFISLGYVLGSFARSVETYNGIANLIFLPLMLLSGVYFSLDAAPLWLQQGAALLPLATLLKALRAIFNDGASFSSQAPLLGVLLGWLAVLFSLAVKRFRWV